VSASDFVTYGRLTLPLAAVRLALALEARGLRLEVDGQDILVGPRELLTDEDRAQLRRWKAHVLAILSYDADAQERTQ